MNLIEATYIVTRPDREPEAMAEAIAREQSLEIVRELIPESIAASHLARVLAVEALDEERYSLRIGYPAHLASAQVGQLLHLLFGNVSFYPRVRLVDLALPDSLLSALPGPRHGLDGIRKAVGVDQRALLMTVLKPRGSSPEFLADLALRFARGGGDIVKDDQNIVEQDLDTFRRRVGACARAIEQAAQSTGRRCLYLPHVAGSGDHLERQLDIVADLDLPGVVMCSWVMGLETAANAARRHQLMWLSHPAMAGVFTESSEHGVATNLLLGTLTRLAGADLSIFPGRGGRIQSGVDDEQTTCTALTAPLGGLRPTLPCLGGGKRLDQLARTARKLGPDLAIVVGGDLLRCGDNLESATRQAVNDLDAVTRDA